MFAKQVLGPAAKQPQRLDLGYKVSYIASPTACPQLPGAACRDSRVPLLPKLFWEVKIKRKTLLFKPPRDLKAYRVFHWAITVTRVLLSISCHSYHVVVAPFCWLKFWEGCFHTPALLLSKGNWGGGAASILTTFRSPRERLLLTSNSEKSFQFVAFLDVGVEVHLIETGHFSEYCPLYFRLVGCFFFFV